jgi:hypothetical protein
LSIIVLAPAERLGGGVLLDQGLGKFKRLHYDNLADRILSLILRHVRVDEVALFCKHAV